MRILAFDTATRATAVALELEGGGRYEARHDPDPGERPGHATQLLGLISSVMDRASVGWQEIDRIAVGLGPGTFTGLRIGVATAKALAQASGAELVGVSTLQALALNAQLVGEPRADVDAAMVLAVLDARRGEVYAGGWEAARLDGPPRLAPQALRPGALADLLQAIDGTVLAIGEGAVAFRDVLECTGVYVPDDASELHRIRAAGHSLLAWRLPVTDPDALAPDYQRPPDAQPRPTIAEKPVDPHGA